MPLAYAYDAQIQRPTELPPLILMLDPQRTSSEASTVKAMTPDHDNIHSPMTVQMRVKRCGVEPEKMVLNNVKHAQKQYEQDRIKNYRLKQTVLYGDYVFRKCLSLTSTATG